MTNLQVKNLVQSAHKLLQQKQYAAAASLYEQAYSLQPDNKAIGRQLVYCLHAAHLDERAFVILQDSWEQYLATIADTNLLIEVVLARPDFISAWQILTAVQWEDAVEKARLQQLIVQQQKLYAQTHAQQQQQIYQQILQILTLPLTQQVTVAANLHFLSREDFLQTVQLLLDNPYLHPMIKASLCEDLVKLKEKSVFTINYYGKQRHFRPQEYPLIAHLKSLTEMLSLLADHHELTAAFVNDLQAEITLYAALLYPFTDIVIMQPKLWLQMILQHFGLEKTVQTLEKDAKAGKVDMWLNKFDELLNLFN